MSKRSKKQTMKGAEYSKSKKEPFIASSSRSSSNIDSDVRKVICKKCNVLLAEEVIHTCALAAEGGQKNSSCVQIIIALKWFL